MELDEFKRKRKVFNALNLAIVVLIVLLSAFSIFLTKQAKADFTAGLFGIISCVFGVMGLVLGRLLPPKEKAVYISDEQTRKLAILNYALNKQVTALSVKQGGYLYRSWNVVGFLIIGILMVLINVVGAAACYGQGMGLAIKVYVATAILWAVLVLPCGLWTYYDGCITANEECGMPIQDAQKKTLRGMVVGMAVVVLIFGSGMLFAYIKGKLDDEKIPVVDVDRINQELAQAQEKLDQLTTDDWFAQQEFENTGEALASIKASHNDRKVYYKLQYTKDDTLNIITWDDESEDVWIDCFDVLEKGRLKQTKSFVSSAIKKEDVLGKETGYIE